MTTTSPPPATRSLRPGREATGNRCVKLDRSFPYFGDGVGAWGDLLPLNPKPTLRRSQARGHAEPHGCLTPKESMNEFVTVRYFVHATMYCCEVLQQRNGGRLRVAQGERTDVPETQISRVDPSSYRYHLPTEAVRS